MRVASSLWNRLPGPVWIASGLVAAFVFWTSTKLGVDPRWPTVVALMVTMVLTPLIGLWKFLRAGVRVAVVAASLVSVSGFVTWLVLVATRKAPG